MVNDEFNRPRGLRLKFFSYETVGFELVAWMFSFIFFGFYLFLFLLFLGLFEQSIGTRLIIVIISTIVFYLLGLIIKQILNLLADDAKIRKRFAWTGVGLFIFGFVFQMFASFV